MASVNGVKICPNCNSKGPFHKKSDRSDGLSVYCQICANAKERLAEQRNRQAILDMLGNKCIKCGFNDARALQVDHINGGGRQERLKFGTKSRTLRKLVEDDINHEKYQLLCANCNVIKKVENGE